MAAHRVVAFACLILAAAALTPGCSKKAAKAQCEQRSEQLAAALAPLGRAPAPLMVPDTIEPIVSSEGAPVNERAPVLVIDGGGGISFQGERLANLDSDLEPRLAADREAARALGHQVPAVLYVFADRSLAAAALEPIARAAPAGTELRLLVTAPAPAAARARRQALLGNPEVARARDAIETGDPSARATAAARVIEESVGTCAPLIKVFGDLALIEGSEKGAHLAEAAPRALRACECRVGNLDVLEYALLGVLGGFDRLVLWVPLARAPGLLGR
jgi:hypothetical protein